jgi:hypothetical protein
LELEVVEPVEWEDDEEEEEDEDGEVAAFFAGDSCDDMSAVVEEEDDAGDTELEDRCSMAGKNCFISIISLSLPLLFIKSLLLSVHLMKSIVALE